MGQRGPGAAKLQTAARKPRRKTLPWRKRALSRPGRVVAFLEFLPVTAGPLAGTKLRVRDWQREIIEGIYGPAADDGRRTVRTALLTTPRKNGKTQLAAGLALCHLLGPEAEQRGQVYSAAADREQAALIFNEMVAMILKTPELAARVNIKQFNRRIEDLETGSLYAALSADARKAHGLNTSFFVYDELAQARDRNLYDSLNTSVGGRAEPLGIVISTQSPDARHVMSELVDYAEQVRDGLVDDPSFFPCVYAAPEDADPWSEETWHACNPALGDFRSLEEMRVTAARAQRIPALETSFRNLYLNQRVEADERFIAAADWHACDAPVDAAALAGRACWGGLGTLAPPRTLRRSSSISRRMAARSCAGSGCHRNSYTHGRSRTGCLIRNGSVTAIWKSPMAALRTGAQSPTLWRRWRRRSTSRASPMTAGISRV